MSTWELFHAAYQSTSPEVRLLIDSEKIAVCVEAALARRNMPQLQTKATTQVSYQVVGAQTIDTTVASLTALGLTDALQFFAEVQAAINQTNVPPSTAPAHSLAAEISATEHDLESLQGIRTMAHDMKEAKTHPITHQPTPETTYQSSQEDILRKTPPVANTGQVARWDTEA
jgi:hypothetical protein